MATSGRMPLDHRSKTLQQMVKERDVRIDQLLDELDRKTRVSSRGHKVVLVDTVVHKKPCKFDIAFLS